MRKYELIPTDGRKSFYGKAVVVVEDNGTEKKLLAFVRQAHYSTK